MSEAPPGSAGLRAQRRLALFVAGWALFDFPLLGSALGRGPGDDLRLPRLPVLFAAWSALIVALAWLMERRASSRTSTPCHPQAMRTPRLRLRAKPEARETPRWSKRR
ncbi:MAG: hypothetical protein U1F49_07175 [Rubrivivax sp.]